jgi:hypothetical protein
MELKVSRAYKEYKEHRAYKVEMVILAVLLLITHSQQIPAIPTRRQEN